MTDAPLTSPQWYERLHTAAVFNDTDAMDLLLREHRARPSLGNVNASLQDDDGDGPVLCIAVGQGHEEVVRRLLQHPGIDPNGRNAIEHPPLFVLTQLPGPNVPMEAMLNALLDAGADPRTMVPGWGTGDPPLSLMAWTIGAAGGNAHRALGVLLERDALALPTDPEARHALMLQAIHATVRTPNNTSVGWLLDQGVPVTDAQGRVPDEALNALRPANPALVVRIEQAILRAGMDGSVDPPGPASPRARL